MAKIATIINYCSNDYRFISSCIEGVSEFSDQVIIPVCDHFYGGMRENRELLHRTYAENPDVEFIQYAYGVPYGLYSDVRENDELWPRHWSNTSRYVGLLYVRDDIDYVLFLDSDEIVDSKRLSNWLENADILDATFFSSYVYLGKESMRSSQKEHAGLLLKKSEICPEMLFNNHERPGYFNAFEKSKAGAVNGLDGEPMIHHYNWVRSKEELVQKVTNWGHKDERDWLKLIEEGTLAEGAGHQYHEVEPVHDLLSIDVEKLKNRDFFDKIPLDVFTNVTLTDRDSVMRLSIEKELLR